MGLTELFNEWIVERGSAKVQEKHIALFKDQLALADKKNVVLTSETTILKTKLELAEAKIQELIKENQELRRKIQEYEQFDEASFKKTEWEPLDPEAGY